MAGIIRKARQRAADAILRRGINSRNVLEQESHHWLERSVEFLPAAEKLQQKLKTAKGKERREIMRKLEAIHTYNLRQINRSVAAKSKSKRAVSRATKWAGRIVGKSKKSK